MSDTRSPRIRVSVNGPYLVEGTLPMAKQIIVVDEKGECVAWEEAERVEDGGDCTLCRCGSSARKPFCDGSHTTIRFDGTETAPRTPYADAADSIEGPTLVLMDEVDLCADARYCFARGKIWRRVLQDGDEPRSVVIEQSAMCPSGRYTAVDAADGSVCEPELEPSVGFVEDPKKGVSGPLWVRGGIPVIAADGEPYEVRNRVTLCRCGGSKNKPFCDGTHIEIGFDDRT